MTAKALPFGAAGRRGGAGPLPVRLTGFESKLTAKSDYIQQQRERPHLLMPRAPSGAAVELGLLCAAS